MSTETKEPQIMFIADVMQEMRMSRVMVTGAIKSGDLPAYSHGTGKFRYRINRGDFEQWRESHRVKEEE